MDQSSLKMKPVKQESGESSDHIFQPVRGGATGVDAIDENQYMKE